MHIPHPVPRQPNMMRTATPDSHDEETFFQMIKLLLHLRNSRCVDRAEPTITAVSLVMRVAQLPRKRAHGLLCNLRRGRHAVLARRILAYKSPTQQTYVLTRASCLELLELLPQRTGAATDRILDELFVESQ